MRVKKTIRTLCVILLLLLVCAGALLILRPHIDSLRRGQVSEELMEKIKSGETDIRIENVPIVEGAEAEFAAEAPAPRTERRPAIEVTGYGVIEIPAIDLAMPLVRGCGEQALMAAAGWYEESAEPGTAGNCVILGHRMSGYGEHFNRLDELKEGDEIVVTLADGTYCTYKVTGTEVIGPAELMARLKEHNDGFALTLVTCTPTGVGSHRLLAYASLTER